MLSRGGPGDGGEASPSCRGGSPRGPGRGCCGRRPRRRRALALLLVTALLLNALAAGLWNAVDWPVVRTDVRLFMETWSKCAFGPEPAFDAAAWAPGGPRCSAALGDRPAHPAGAAAAAASRAATAPPRLLFVTFTNAGFLPLTCAWLCSARAVGIPPAAMRVFDLDGSVCVELERLGATGSLADGTAVACVPVNATRQVDPASQGFGADQYWNIMVQRMHVLEALIACGHDIFLTDADSIFLSDPRPHVAAAAYARDDAIFSRDYAGLAWVDASPVASVCAGFFFMRATAANRALLGRMRGVMAEGPAPMRNDQIAFNACLRAPNAPRWSFLPVDRFPNGRRVFGERGAGAPGRSGLDPSESDGGADVAARRALPAPPPPGPAVRGIRPAPGKGLAGAVVVHANWLNDIDSKVAALKRLHLWCEA